MKIYRPRGAAPFKPTDKRTVVQFALGELGREYCVGKNLGNGRSVPHQIVSYPPGSGCPMCKCAVTLQHMVKMLDEMEVTYKKAIKDMTRKLKKCKR